MSRKQREQEHIQFINDTQNLFEETIQTNNFDLIHKTRMMRDQVIQDFTQEYDRRPEQERASRRWR